MKRFFKRAVPAFLATVLACNVVPAQLFPQLSPQLSPQLPALGEGDGMSLAAERRLGDSIMRDIYRDPDYIDDPLLLEYVQDIWAQLLQAAKARGELLPEMETRFAFAPMLIRDRAVNAFALPGGYMGVNLGLIAIVANRDELASVLAHELSHVTQRHISRMEADQGRKSPLFIAALLLGVLAASKSPDAGGAILTGAQAGMIQNQLNFSRDMEREADRVGFNVLTQAGYAPTAFASMFEKLRKASNFNDNGSYPYLRSHPLTDARIADMQLRVSEATSSAQAAARMGSPAPASAWVHAMLAARARILADPKNTDAQNKAVQEGKRSNDVAALYAATLSAMKLRDPSAKGLLQRLAMQVQIDPAATRVVRLLRAELALAQGATDLPYLSAVASRPELMLNAQASLAAGNDGAGVLPALQSWVNNHGQDALAWEWLARVAALQGQELYGLRADAEARVAHFDYPAAVERFKRAQTVARTASKPGDHIEASIVDTRLHQVEALMREEAKEKKGY